MYDLKSCVEFMRTGENHLCVISRDALKRNIIYDKSVE